MVVVKKRALQPAPNGYYVSLCDVAESRPDAFAVVSGGVRYVYTRGESVFDCGGESLGVVYSTLDVDAPSGSILVVDDGRRSAEHPCDLGLPASMVVVGREGAWPSGGRDWGWVVISTDAGSKYADVRHMSGPKCVSRRKVARPVARRLFHAAVTAFGGRSRAQVSMR